MFGLGFSEIVVILIVALIVFGPDRLPEIARTLGKTFNGFHRSLDELRRSLALDQCLIEPPPTTPQPPPLAAAADTTVHPTPDTPPKQEHPRDKN